MTQKAIRLATCNLRFDNPEDPYLWKDRLPLLRDFILEKSPDVLATQEGRREQIYQLLDSLKEHYSIIDQHRNWGTKRMFPALFIKKNWQVLSSCDRWLSKTPEFESKDFGSMWPKLAVLAKVQRKESEPAFVIGSFHLDNASSEARPHQAKVLLEVIDKEYKGLDVILMGDANDGPDSEALAKFKYRGFNDPWNYAEKPNTFHDFGSGNHNFRIDYILHQSEKLKVIDYFCDDRKSNFYSDHYYLSVDYMLK